MYTYGPVEYDTEMYLPPTFLTDPSVRDNAAEALGTALKVVGDKTLLPFLSDVDNLKMVKVGSTASKTFILHNA